MALIKKKQIDAAFGASFAITGFTADGADDIITTELTTALGSAGFNGGAVPVQISAGEGQEGVITTGNANLVQVFDATTNEKLVDGGGNEIYARITEAAGVYTLTYYSLVSGVETAYTSFSSQSLNLVLPYRYTLKNLPGDFALTLDATYVQQDPNLGGGVATEEQITVTATNTINNLTSAPVSGRPIQLIVNGKVESSDATAAPFSVAGQAITWSAVNAMYDLETTDVVIARYFTAV